MSSRNAPPSDRGSAAVAAIIVLVLVQLFVIGALLGVRRDQDLTAKRLETVRAFYAAEAGMNMSIREMMLNTDEDADGGIGSISDDDDLATDPTLSGEARMSVRRKTGTDAVTVVRSHGRCGEARRDVEASLE